MKLCDDSKEIKLLNLEIIVKNNLPHLQRNFSSNYVKKLNSNKQSLERKLKPLLNKLNKTQSLINFNDIISRQRVNIHLNKQISKKVENKSNSQKSSFYELIPFNEIKSYVNVEKQINNKRLSNIYLDKKSEFQMRIPKTLNNKEDKLNMNEDNIFKEKKDDSMKEENPYKSPETSKVHNIESETLKMIMSRKVNTSNSIKNNSSLSLENYIGRLNSFDINIGIGPNCSGIKIEKLKEIQNEVLNKLNFKRSIDMHNLMKKKFPKNIKFNFNKLIKKPVLNNLKPKEYTSKNLLNLNEVEKKIMTQYSQKI